MAVWPPLFDVILNFKVDAHDIDRARLALLETYEKLDDKSDILKAPQLRNLYAALKTVPAANRPALGRRINQLKIELETKLRTWQDGSEGQDRSPIDVTAPFGVNAKPLDKSGLLPAEQGSLHPVTQELDRMVDIFQRIGFEAVESRQLDDEFNMFTALNFPPDHPARDSYDSFRTEEGLIPPAHTSTMQHRILKQGKQRLAAGQAIATVIYGRCFRNEDVDATHDHTFYQLEGVYVSGDASLGQMLALLKHFYERYFNQIVKIKTQPAYFPFVEPGLEFAIEKPASIGGKPGQWLEVLGCGMIHPNVLRLAGIDPERYRGFAWGGGIERLVMLRHGIEDIRHFESGNLKFLRQF